MAFLLLLPQLLAAGLATVDQVKALVAAKQPGMTDVELDAVLDLIVAGAAKHQALAQTDQK